MRINTDKFLIMSLFFIAFYYLSYRYPLSINSSSTSPTYSDTPFLLAVGKYLAVLLVCIIYIFLSLFSSKRVRKNKKHYFYVLVYIFLLIFPIIVSGVSGTKNWAPIFEIGFFFICSISLLLFCRESGIKLQDLFEVIKIFLYVALIVNVIQIFIFFIFGRLPALAYQGTISIRFGSLWDDPNSFSVFLSFLIPFSLIAFEGLKRVLIVFISLLFLIITQSLTGLVGFLMAFILGYFLLFLFSKKKQYLFFLVSFFLSTVFLYFIFSYVPFFQDIVSEFMLSKQGSIDNHLREFEILNDFSWLIFLGLSPSGVLTESGWLNLLFNLGFLFTVVYFFVSARAVFVYAKLVAKNKLYKEEKAVAMGAMIFLISFILSSFNLPLAIIFPLNLLMILFISISHFITDTNEISN